MKIAVTTASGALGAAIAKGLVESIGRESVVGIARTPEKASYLGVEIRKGDYNSKSDFNAALKGIDIVLLVSGMDHPDNRIVQHRNVINAAKKNGVRKIVYTSIIGKEGTTTFDGIVKSNRQTEKDIQGSGLQWAIGRNGLYIEPDVDYMDKYKEFGKVANCAGNGLCSYTTRGELAYAYIQMMLNNDRNGKIFELTGEAISQHRLTAYLNSVFDTKLEFEDMTVTEYLKFQKKVNGEFLGPVIAGIYTKIRNGEFDVRSDFKTAAGREHVSWDKFFKNIKQA